MSPRTTLVLAGDVHRRLQAHLFPGDQLEAAAILLCTRMKLDQLKLLVKDVMLVPHEDCHRAHNQITWPGEWVEEAIDRAEADGLAIILIHSHPSGMLAFSEADDASDRIVIPAIAAEFNSDEPEGPVNGTAIMIPGGAIRARIYSRSNSPRTIDLVAVYGDDIQFYWGSDAEAKRRPMAFSDEMRREIGRLHFALVGVSGTGSVVGQQLARLGAGEITAVDHDRMELRNLNRVLASTRVNAKEQSLKVDVFRRDVATYSPETDVRPIALSIATREAVLAVAKADVIFCCVDSDEGRSVCDRMSEAFLQPLFDVGVVIPVRTTTVGSEAILEISGRIDYVQPGGASLEDRGVYSPQTLAAEDLARADTEEFAQRVKEGYMPGSAQQAPSVITVNMRAASACVQEFIARAYPYRVDGNRGCARTVFGLAAGDEDVQGEDDFPVHEKSLLAIGLNEPLLGLPGLV